MAELTQSFKNHARFHPPFHYVLMPILILHLILSIRRLIANPGWDSAEFALLALGSLVMGFPTRVNALKAQDRTIRLEERLRYQQLLPADLAKSAARLRTGQIVALRFAPDEELSGIVSQVLSGKLKSQKEIKQSILNWRADHDRV